MRKDALGKYSCPGVQLLSHRLCGVYTTTPFFDLQVSVMIKCEVILGDSMEGDRCVWGGGKHARKTELNEKLY